MRVVQPKKDEFRIAIEFDREEAEALMSITGAVGGCPKKSPRRFFDELRMILRGSGVQNGPSTTGAITFYET